MELLGLVAPAHERREDPEMRKILGASCVFAASTFATIVSAKEVDVSDANGLASAIAAAQPGDEIVLAAGTYDSTGITCAANGTASQPIVVRSSTPLGAKIRFDALEGFHVTGAYWHFEGLDVTGVCAVDSNCEHAFHVTGGAIGFVMRENRVFDFDAQLKVNSDQDSTGKWIIPHGGLVEGNEVGDHHARATSNPVTKLNIDSGDRWIVRANYIHDGHKNGGDYTSYQAFMKAGGKNGLFERNLVICAKDIPLGASNDVRIGLSFGGGGTGPGFCEPNFDPNGTCDPEHTNGVMRNNVIVNCSDVGIYLNKSASTKILFNTLIATSGIDFRFASSGGVAIGNVLEGAIRERDGATFTGTNNLTGVTAAQFAGWYLDPLNGDLRKKGDLSALLQQAPTNVDVPDDYCARARTDPKDDLGALESTLGDCVTTTPPLGSTAPGDAGDAGNGDAAPPTDAAIDDASTGFDAGGDAASVQDATTEDDAGMTTPSGGSSGCGCRTTNEDASAAGVGALAILLSLATMRRRWRASI